MKTWKEKCQSPKWQKLRLDILERDNWRCTICGNSKDNLQVHHIIYLKSVENPWDYDAKMLQTLCRGCHEGRQDLIDNAANALKIQLSRVPTDRVINVAQHLFEKAMEEL